MTNDDAIFVLSCVEAHGLAEEARKLAIVALRERRHGRWNYKPIFPTDTETSPTYHIGHLVCSVCGAIHANAQPENFCDNCGAKMDEVKE